MKEWVGHVIVIVYNKYDDFMELLKSRIFPRLKYHVQYFNVKPLYIVSKVLFILYGLIMVSFTAYS